MVSLVKVGFGMSVVLLLAGFWVGVNDISRELANLFILSASTIAFLVGLAGIFAQNKLEKKLINDVAKVVADHIQK